MENILQVDGLAKIYRGFSLENVSFSVPRGTVMGFIGSNGAGKTTTIKIILGLIKRSAGSVELFGRAFEPMSNARENYSMKDRIGVVFDTCAFPENITVRDAGIIMRASYTSWDDGLFTGYLHTFNLPADKKIKELSRGMGMKLSLASALAHNPELLILDEATAGLDPLARDEVLDILRDFMRDETHGIFISSHITSDLEKIADYITLIDNGQIVFCLEKDAITDAMGVARCRRAEFERVMASGLLPSEYRFYHTNPYGIDLLIPDRTVFQKEFPSVVVDRASIDDVMLLLLKGETR